MSETGTTYTGPLGSTIHVLRADADTKEAVARIVRRRQHTSVRVREE